MKTNPLLKDLFSVVGEMVVASVLKQSRENWTTQPEALRHWCKVLRATADKIDPDKKAKR